MSRYVCKECFLDNELKGFIRSQSNIGACSFCGSDHVETLPIEELYDFFSELFESFEPNEKGDSVLSKLSSNWDLFSGSAVGAKIMNCVIPNIDTDIHSADELVEFTDDILQNVGYWQKLKDQLKWERRYLTDIDYLIEELGWDGFFNSKVTIKSEDVFYRARLHVKPSMTCFPIEEMSSPPRESVLGGRSNPPGIPFLYLSDNPETILYEVRASYLDEVTIGEFSLKDGQREEVVISDFTEMTTLFHPGEISKRIKSTLLKKSISRDLSKPMRRYDSELDYIPTQFICEFIKVFTNVQGIKFRSSLHTVGNNIVLFDKDSVECRNVAKHQVKKIEIISRTVKS